MLKRGCWKIIELKRNPIMVKPSDISIHGYCMCLLTSEHNRMKLETEEIQYVNMSFDKVQRKILIVFGKLSFELAVA